MMRVFETEVCLLMLFGSLFLIGIYWQLKRVADFLEEVFLRAENEPPYFDEGDDDDEEEWDEEEDVLDIHEGWGPDKHP